MTDEYNTRNKKIILIDDDQDDHETFRLALREVEPSIDFVCYHSAEDALGKLTNDTSALPEYIFLDLDMPGMNGIQFLEQFKQSHIGHLPVVIYSTLIFPILQRKLDELGKFHTLVKPNTDRELVNILKNILLPHKN